MNECERARKEVNFILMRHVGVLIDDYSFGKLTKEILSNPGIAILADDQSLPDNPYRLARKYNLSYACKLVQQDMLQARFLKVVKKEE